MRTYIILFFLFLHTFLFAQEFIQPVKEINYGNNNHTNRDFLNGTLRDSNGNIYLLGSTENDFTFNDVKIIKLDSDLNVLWEKDKSFDAGISYDGVMDAHIDSNNDLLLLCRAAYTSFNQTFIALKYSSSGELLWEHPLSDLSAPIDYNFYTLQTFLDSSDALIAKFQPVNQSAPEFFFLKLSSSGTVVEDYSLTEPFTEELGGPNVHEMLFYNNLFYMIAMDSQQKFLLNIFNETTFTSHELGLTTEQINFFKSQYAEASTNMKRDNNNNMIVVCPDYNTEKDYGILNVQADGDVQYVVLPDNNKERYPLDFAFDSDNNLLIISNNRPLGTNNTLEVTLQKYDQTGSLVYESSKSYIGQIATIVENKIAILTESNKIVSFDFDFNEIDNIQLSNIDTNNFELNDLLITDSNYFLSGYTEDVNYENSVLISEIDMLIKKTSQIEELSTYRFSGVGTSRIFQRKEVVVRDTAFAVAFIEKLGPDNYSPGGSIGPEQQRFLTLDKNDLSILEDKIVPLDEILYTTYYDRELTTPYESNGDLFEYVISSDTTNVSLYKNDQLEWSRDLDLYEDPYGDPIISDDEIIFDWKVNQKGDFYLSTFIYGLQEFTLHKYSLENEYQTLERDELVIITQPLTNHWLFTVTRNGSITIYSDRLTIINQTQNPFGYLSQFSFYVAEKNNQILLHKHNQQEIRRLNQFGETQSDYFEVDVPIDLGTNPFIEYDNEHLVVLDIFGSSISMSPEYTWARAVIKKYDLDVTHTFDEISYDDDDNDGISNDIDECRDTPSNETANQYGCSSSQTLSNDLYNFVTYGISIYPNPTSGYLNFDLKDIHKLKKIEVYDALGRRITSIDSPEKIAAQTINLMYQTSGIYSIKFYFKDNQIMNKKIIKVR